MKSNTYVANEIYHTAIDKLEVIARTFDPADPSDIRSAIIQVLGEDMDIWPEDCSREDSAPRRAA